MIHWMPSDEQIAQTCHFALAWAMVVTAALFGASWWVCALLVICWTLPKEFAFDLAVENDSILDSATDALWYMIGMAFGLAVLYVRSIM
jgi:hypothetical protein